MIGLDDYVVEFCGGSKFAYIKVIDSNSGLYVRMEDFLLKNFDRSFAMINNFSAEFDNTICGNNADPGYKFLEMRQLPIVKFFDKFLGVNRETLERRKKW